MMLAVVPLRLPRWHAVRMAMALAVVHDARRYPIVARRYAQNVSRDPWALDVRPWSAVRRCHEPRIVVQRVVPAAVREVVVREVRRIAHLRRSRHDDEPRRRLDHE